jgi:WhiB family redox-sensing transcriptional regulator
VTRPVHAWRDRAACADADPALWFPEGAPATEAVRICRTCPVRRECVADDLAFPFPAGVRAGLDADVRAPLNTAYVNYRALVATRCEVLRRTATRANGRAARVLADALAAEADAVAGYAVALALTVPPAEWTAARDAYTAAIAARQTAEADAGMRAGTARIDRAWVRLLAAAHRLALTTTAAPAALVVPSSLAGAA